MIHLRVVAPDGVGEIRPGDDLVALFLDALAPTGHTLADGEIVAVTSKVVSKAEGQLLTGTRDDVLPGETRRVVARRGPTSIVRTRLGLTMAAAGIDASNVPAGTVALHPQDPDASARAFRAELRRRTGVNVGVILTDTAGRAWREGQTDIAIGAAGLEVVEEFAGREDGHGNPLAVTAPAVADEVAGVAELAAGKLSGRPFVVISGRSDLVLDPDADGPGATALNRPEERDFFGYGAREAVVRALAGRPGDAAPFGAVAPVEDVVAALRTVFDVAARPRPDGGLDVPLPHSETLAALAFAHRWSATPLSAHRAASTQLHPST